jgi:hypothetical protein
VSIAFEGFWVVADFFPVFARLECDGQNHIMTCMQEASKKHAAKIAAAAQERSKKKAALKEKVAAAKEWSEEEVRMHYFSLDYLPSPLFSVLTFLPNVCIPHLPATSKIY